MKIEINEDGSVTKKKSKLIKLKACADIAEQYAAQLDKWVSCKDRLPTDDNQLCLFVCLHQELALYGYLGTYIIYPRKQRS